MEREITSKANSIKPNQILSKEGYSYLGLKIYLCFSIYNNWHEIKDNLANKNKTRRLKTKKSHRHEKSDPGVQFRGIKYNAPPQRKKALIALGSKVRL